MKMTYKYGIGALCADSLPGGEAQEKELYVLQVSARGGEVFCCDQGDRVAIAGRAVFIWKG